MPPPELTKPTVALGEYNSATIMLLKMKDLFKSYFV